jgi:hypothetical protein
MPGASSGGEVPRGHVSITALMEAIRAQWDQMGEEERAFLIYCLQRLHMQRDESESQKKVPPADGRDSIAPCRTCGM